MALDEARENFCEQIYDMFSNEPNNDKANQIIDLFDEATENLIDKEKYQLAVNTLRHIARRTGVKCGFRNEWTEAEAFTKCNVSARRCLFHINEPLYPKHKPGNGKCTLLNKEYTEMCLRCRGIKYYEINDCLHKESDLE